MIQCPRVLLLVVLVVVLVDGVVLEAAVDEVAEGGGVVGEVVLLEEVHKVLKVELDGVVLKHMYRTGDQDVTQEMEKN